MNSNKAWLIFVKVALTTVFVDGLNSRTWAASFVYADYSAGSSILDISARASVGPHPTSVTILPVVIPAGLGAQGGGSAQGLNDVHHGMIKLYAKMTASANSSLNPPNIDRTHQAAFNAGFEDSVTVSVPAVAVGTPIVIVPAISIDYKFSGSASGFDSDASYASPGFLVNVSHERGPLHGGLDYQQRSGGCFFSAAFTPDPCPSPAVDSWVLDPITVKSGVSFSLTTYAQAAAGGRTIPGGSMAAESDLSTTITWLGVAAVMLTNQTVVSNYTFTSESGFNYGAKVSANANSAPSLSVVVDSPDTLTISWMSVPFQIYRLESRASFSSGSWTGLGEMMVGDGLQITIPQDTLGTQQYYRVACIPNP